MVTAPKILGGDLKISEQNNWGEPEQKNTFGGWAKFKGGPNILGGAYEPQWYHGRYVKIYSFIFVGF